MALILLHVTTCIALLLLVVVRFGRKTKMPFEIFFRPLVNLIVLVLAHDGVEIII
jgi:hypothetical protein